MAHVMFSINVDGLDAVIKKINAGCTKAEEKLANEVRKDTDPYTPFLNGVMSASTEVRDNLIIYPGPQSRYLYYGKLMVDPITGSPWARKDVTKELAAPPVFLHYTDAPHEKACAKWFEVSKAHNLQKWIKQAGEFIADEL